MSTTVQRLPISKIFSLIQRIMGKIERTLSKNNATDSRSLILSRSDFAITNPDYLTVGEGAYFNPETEMVTPKPSSLPNTSIIIGKNASIGRRNKFEVLEGNTLVMGERATTSYGCNISGDVRIGNHAMLGPGVMVSSGNHVSRVKPSWLIRDQNEIVRRDPSRWSEWQKPVYIGEDAWIGYNTYINHGIYIGRGAVIGPDSFVVKDIAPYAMALGAPAREYDKRLNFEPKNEISATDENHYPYFYEGFYLNRTDLEPVKEYGVIPARDKTMIIIPSGSWRNIQITGRVFQPRENLKMRLSCHGVTLGEQTINGDTFGLTFSFENYVRPARTVASVMQKYREIEIDLSYVATLADKRGEVGYRIGIGSVSVS